jgi:hemerythrin-like domain-containing protein
MKRLNGKLKKASIMKTATQDLSDEHDVILQALDIMQVISEKLQRNETADRKDILDLLDFLSEFADRCHHGKEEDLLIPGILKFGLFDNNGPIRAILSEHSQGREHIAKMRKSIAGETINNDEFVGSSLAYVSLLREHIRKENTLLFPLIDSWMPTEELYLMYDKFMEFEEREIGKGHHEELHALLEALKSIYLISEETTGSRS